MAPRQPLVIELPSQTAYVQATRLYKKLSDALYALQNAVMLVPDPDRHELMSKLNKTAAALDAAINKFEYESIVVRRDPNREHPPGPSSLETIMGDNSGVKGD